MCWDSVPDRTVFDVGIRRADGADDSVPGCIFFDLHDIAATLKHWGLIHVFHGDLDDGLVPEGAHGEEAWVDVDIFHLNPQSVLLFPLKVQRLEDRVEIRMRKLCCNFTCFSVFLNVTFTLAFCLALFVIVAIFSFKH